MWIIITLVCAFFFATSDALSKAALRDSPPFGLAWVRYALGAPFLWVFLPWCRLPPEIGQYALYFALAMPLEILAIVFYMRALSRSPLSLTVPFLAFTPVAAIFTGWLILGEKPNLAGIGGVFLVAGGAYVLSLRKEVPGLLSPFRLLLVERGSLMMLAVAMIYSVTAIAGKKMVLLSSPFFMAISYNLGMSIALTFFLALRHGPQIFPKLVTRPILWAVGLSESLHAATHVIAITMAPAAYMIAVKRVSLFFGVLYGIFLFREGSAAFRLAGSLIMLLGVFTLAFFR